MKTKINMIAANGKRAVIYFNAETAEYSITFFAGAEKLESAEYFTLDEDDAIETACHFVNFWEKP